jgi:phosphatidylglycerol:prolipoprotein diacylglycerol transferase
MRQTLFTIPLDGPWALGPFKVSGFGFGIALVGWIVFGIVWLYRNPRERAHLRTLLVPVGTWLAVAAAIILVPWIVERPATAKIAEADKVLAADPGSLEALLPRAQARFSKLDYHGALEDFQTAARVHPESALALNRLAWIEATCPDASVRDGAAAVAHAQKACELTSSRNPEYLATLSAAEAECGEFQKAIEAERKALHLVSSLSSAEDANVLDKVPRMREQLQAAEQSRAFRDRPGGTNLPVYGFGAMLFLAFIAGTWSAARRGLRVGYPPEMMWDLGIWLFITGVIGCRIFYCIQFSQRVFYNFENGQYVLKSLPGMLFAAVNLPDGGLVWFGGLIAGLLTAMWYARRRKISLLELGDVVVPTLFLGLAFGRIGCFLNGCCYGDRCDLPWGVHFPMGSVPDMSLVLRGYLGADQDFSPRLHPTQLYSSLSAFILFFLTDTYFKYRPRNGSVIALGSFTYAITRFTVEFLRDDEVGQFHTSLTISQWFSIVLFIFAVVFTAWLARRPELRPAPHRASTREPLTA